MKRLSLLIKPASSLCNMRCAYCFYHDAGRHREVPSYGLMGGETAERIIDNICRDMDGDGEVTIAFQGGEPTLAGLGWFEHFVSYMNIRRGGLRVNYALQTNGLLLDEGWAEFLHGNNFLTGLSIDGLERFHNANRRDAAGKGTWDACLGAKALLDRHGAEYNILCVLTNGLAGEPDKVWNFILRENIRFIQFIPCLGGLDGEGVSPLALRPARFASFYTRLYFRWMKELERGDYFSVKLFDDTANFFFRGIPSSCGIDGRCHVQYVVEADGSVYPCDFYALDRYNGGNLGEHGPRELFDRPAMRLFLQEERVLSGLCRSCSWLERCGGGCKRMGDVMYAGSPASAAGNAAASAAGPVCGYKLFLDKCLRSLEYTVRRYFP